MNNERIVPRGTKIRRQDKMPSLLSIESTLSSKLHNLLMEYVEDSNGVTSAYLSVTRRSMHKDIDKLFDTLNINEKIKKLAVGILLALTLT